MSDKIPVSVLIMTKNEEMNIRKCLESVKWADEIVMVDSASTDRTLEIAGEYTDRIYRYTWDKKWPKKIWSLEKPGFRNDWILMIDADERATEEFREEIAPVVSGEDSGCAGFIVRYHYWFLGRYIKYSDPVRKLILFRKSKARFESYDISGADAIEDLEVGHEHPVIDGKVGRVKAPILHEDTRPLYYYFDRHNRYSTWEAYLIHKGKYKEEEAAVKPGISGGWLNMRRLMKYVFLHLPLKPLVYFVYSYIFRLGLLDGYAGFMYNLCKVFYVFQIDIKLNELKLREKKSKYFPT
ncbi:MAG: glycosyltransferase family 2 protein [Candidatus Omnitrophota bacterium]|nr:glycosyltransferase family 2 protein [Candidatus Omnitrophota bacterium]